MFETKQGEAMMKRWLLLTTAFGLGAAFAADPAAAIEQPDAAQIIQKDLLKPAWRRSSSR
jgi:hypothetical protein